MLNSMGRAAANHDNWAAQSQNQLLRCAGTLIFISPVLQRGVGGLSHNFAHPASPRPSTIPIEFWATRCKISSFS